jgi:hypothetical protein
MSPGPSLGLTWHDDDNGQHGGSAADRRRRDLAPRPRRAATAGEGGHPRARRHRRPAPTPADGGPAGLHPGGRGRPGPAGRRLRRSAPADHVPPHVVTGSGVAVRGLHRLDLAVHPAGLPDPVRRPLCHRHPGSDRRGAGVQGEGRQPDDLVLHRRQLLRSGRRRPGRWWLRGERVPARRGHRLPHVAHRRPRHRAAQPHLPADRPAALGPTGAVAGLTGRLAQVADVRGLARLPGHRSAVRTASTEVGEDPARAQGPPAAG